MTAAPQDYGHCATLLADGDRDAWLAALFMPEAVRAHIHALYAFAHEIERIPHLVSDPRLGEIRLQWWIEAIDGRRQGEAALNPVSAALLDTMERFRLPVPALQNMVEARRFDLYSDPMPSLNDLEGWCGETQGALLRLATLVLSGGEDNEAGAACGHAGVALGITRILRSLPVHAYRKQCFIPRDVLERHGASVEAVAAGLMSPALKRALTEMRDAARLHFDLAQREIADLPERLRPAFTRLATVPLYLKAMAKRDDPFATEIEVAQWRRQWAMWRFG